MIGNGYFYTCDYCKGPLTPTIPPLADCDSALLCRECWARAGDYFKADVSNTLKTRYDCEGAPGWCRLMNRDFLQLPPYPPPPTAMVVVSDEDLALLRLVAAGKAWKVPYMKLERLICEGYVNARGTGLTERGLHEISVDRKPT